MADVYFITELKNGIPEFKAATDKDRKALDNFRVGCNEEQLVKAEFKKVKQRELDMHKLNAHYFAYIHEWLSQFDFGKDFIEFSIPKKHPHVQVDALHEQLKVMAIRIMPELLREIPDKDGRPTYHFFSLRVGDKKKDPFILSFDERKKYIDWVFEFAIALQEEKAGWHIPAWSEVEL
jgi:hypothetical protein